MRRSRIRLLAVLLAAGTLGGGFVDALPGVAAVAPGSTGPSSVPHPASAPVQPGHLPVEGAHLPRASRTPSAVGVYSWITGWNIYNGTWDQLINGEGGAFLIDDHTNNQTVFGGLASGGLSNVTQEFNDTPYNWSGFELMLPGPSPRANMSYASDDPLNIGVIFGGITDLSAQAVTNETWVFDFPTEAWENATGRVAPSRRESAAMAIDPAAGVALLEGGVDPSFRSGGSTGVALWNDTWVLNLSTRSWSRLSLAGAPPPMYGSSMIFDPLDGRFYLFGGCGDVCHGSLWSYQLGDTAWKAVNTTGYSVPPRASAALEWDPHQSDATLFGGFTPGPNGPLSLDDTDVFDPSTARWTRLSLEGSPPPLYDFTVAQPEMNGCHAMVLWSGSNALHGPPPDAWMLTGPNEGYINCFIPILPNGSNSPPPPCPNATTTLTISVVDNATGAPVAGASVSLDGPCSPGVVTTDANGSSVVQVPPAIAWNVTVTQVGYYTSHLVYAAPAVPAAGLVVRLRDLPFATVHCYGLGASPVPYPLGGVVVTLDGSVVLGTCDDAGRLGPIQLPFAGGTLTFTGVLAQYSGSNDSVATPPDANVSANLTLRPSGPLDVEVVAAGDGRPVPGAAGILATRDPLSVDPIPFRTGPDGWFNLTVGAANFTVTVAARGLTTTTVGPTFHPWAVRTVWRIVLPALAGCNLTVTLVDATTGAPIAAGSVSVAPNTSGTTGPDGAVRFSGLRPPGPAEVVGSAAGYQTASALEVLTSTGTLPPLVLRLVPAPACAGTGPCALGTNGTAAPGFHLLPTGGWALTFLAFTPVGMLVAAVAVLGFRKVWRAGSGLRAG